MGKRKTLQQEVKPAKQTYAPRYSSAWETNDLFKDWVAPVPNDIHNAICRYCKTTLRAHLSDLRSHGQTSKHLNNIPSEAPAVSEPLSNRRKTREIEIAISNYESAIMGKRKALQQEVEPAKRTYAPKYNNAWGRNALFKDWVAPVPNDIHTACCRFCKTTLRAHFSDLRSHGQTSKHLNNMPIEAPAVSEPISIRRKSREVEMATWVACHEPSWGALNELGTIVRQAFCDLGFKMHRRKCEALITQVLAPYFAGELKNDIKGKPFSLFLVESVTEVNRERVLCLCVRYFSTELREVVSTFFGTIVVTPGNANKVAMGVLSVLADFELDIKQLVGIAADSSTSHLNALFEHLKKDAPDSILLPCSCHSLEFLAKKSTDELPAKLQYMIRESYNWFLEDGRREADRQVFDLVFHNLAEEFYDLAGGTNAKDNNLVHLSSLNNTFLMLADCLERLLANYDTLKRHFRSADTNGKCHVASMLCEMYDDELVHAYLMFLSPILSELRRVSQLIRMAEGENMSRGYNELYNLLLNLCKRMVRPAILRAKSNSIYELNFHQDGSIFLSLDDVDFGSSLTDALDLLGISEDDKRDVLVSCFRFLKSMVIGCVNCFSTSSKSILQNLENTVPANFKDDPSKWDSLLSFVSSASNQDAKIEIGDLSSATWVNWDDTIKFWTEVYFYRDRSGENPFENLSRCVMKLLILPITDAKIERIFTQFEAKKNELRDPTKLEWLTSIMYVQHGLRRINKNCSQFVPPKALLRSFESRMYD